MSTCTSNTGYKEPEWAVQPTSSTSWSLTEIKCGVEIGNHGLSTRATTILGRAVDQVHIPLHHESISRQHARISFDSQGNPWLRDLKSAHGTYVNKRKLPPAAIGKVESNSRQKGARGILLFVGDILKLGASSRYFSLEGPTPPQHQPEHDENRLQAKLLQQDKRLLSSSLSKSVASESMTTTNTSKDEEISWGISMDDHDDGDSDGDGDNVRTTSRSIPTDPLKIPEKYRKELDKLNAMKYKLTNLETEDSRIRRKGELTEGQEKQLQRNAERETALRKSIQDKEASLYEKLNDTKDKSGKSKSRKALNNVHKNNYEEEGDDDYFDRTKGDSNKHSNMDSSTEEAESEETLTVKWKKYTEEQNHLQTIALLKVNTRAESLKDILKIMQATGDDEAFFVQNDLQLALEAKTKVESSLAKNSTTMDEIEQLLKVVNPKIHCDRTTGYIGEGRRRPQQQQPLLSSPPISSSSSEKQQNSNNGDVKIQKNNDEPYTTTRTMQPPPMLPPKQNTNVAAAAAETNSNNGSVIIQKNNDEPNTTTRTMQPPPMLPPKQNTAVAVASAETSCNTKKFDDTSMPPPPSMQNEPVRTTAANNNNEIIAVTMPPPNKRKRILGPVAGPPTKPSQSSSTLSVVARSKQSSSKGERIGTLSFLNNSNSTISKVINNTPQNNNESKNVEAGKQQIQKASQQQLSMDSTSDVWRAPKGQDGSGRTKLNEKFAGRY